jgi:hypothetical protein
MTQEERSIFWEVTVSVILSKKVYTTKDIRKVKIQSPENICKEFFYSLIALLQHTFIYFSTCMYICMYVCMYV